MAMRALGAQLSAEATEEMFGFGLFSQPSASVAAWRSLGFREFVSCLCIGSVLQLFPLLPVPVPTGPSSAWWVGESAGAAPSDSQSSDKSEGSASAMRVAGELLLPGAGVLLLPAPLKLPAPQPLPAPAPLPLPASPANAAAGVLPAPRTAGGGELQAPPASLEEGDGAAESGRTLVRALRLVLEAYVLFDTDASGTIDRAEVLAIIDAENLLASRALAAGRAGGSGRRGQAGGGGSELGGAGPVRGSCAQGGAAPGSASCARAGAAPCAHVDDDGTAASARVGDGTASGAGNGLSGTEEASASGALAAGEAASTAAPHSEPPSVQSPALPPSSPATPPTPLLLPAPPRHCPPPPLSSSGGRWGILLHASGSAAPALPSPRKSSSRTMHAHVLPLLSLRGLVPVVGGSARRRSEPQNALLSRERWLELDWDRDGQASFREFLRTFFAWVGVDEDEEEDSEEEQEGSGSPVRSLPSSSRATPQSAREVERASARTLPRGAAGEAAAAPRGSSPGTVLRVPPQVATRAMRVTPAAAATRGASAATARVAPAAALPEPPPPPSDAGEPGIPAPRPRAPLLAFTAAAEGGGSMRAIVMIGKAVLRGSTSLIFAPISGTSPRQAPASSPRGVSPPHLHHARKQPHLNADGTPVGILKRPPTMRQLLEVGGPGGLAEEARE